MPAMYAHKRFGLAVKEKLDASLQDIIELCPNAFLMGLQGPDILFFYKPYKTNDIVAYGNRIHQESGTTFFTPAVSVVKKYGIQSIQHAYILGFLCHYALDSVCHPYVEEAIAFSGVDHLSMESEFEKYMLRKNKHNPFTYPYDKDVHVQEEVAQAIAPFYPACTEKDIMDSLKGMKQIKKWLITPTKGKQRLYKMGMSIAMLKKYKGLLLEFHDIPACEETNLALYHRYEKSVDIALELIHAFEESVTCGKELPKRFLRNFE